ncbi:NAD-dependent epimerase/dehydratase family protein [Halovulum sp. GXIMD14793]
MHALITGASGLVGHLVATGLQARGWQITRLGRQAGDIPYVLGDRPDLPQADLLVHCAFAHVPGRYRGGEGDDPETFRRLNLDGSQALFEAARPSVCRLIFLSSRAVYGPKAPGAELTEDTPATPDTLYGQIKLLTEEALAALTAPDFLPISLRVTGVYGPPPPGRAHKWTDLFADFRDGHPIASRIATEVHGDDLAAAIDLLSGAGAGIYNVSDILLDRYDLLAEVADLTGCCSRLPRRSAALPNVMNTGRLRSLGWQPGGVAKLRKTLKELL